MRPLTESSRQGCHPSYFTSIGNDLLADVTEEIFRLGSTSSSSILFDAAQQLDRGSPKADENIQLIRLSLPSAVAACIEAAGQQYDIHWQRQLLKAASFGKSVLDLYSSDGFVEMCQTLRILNSVRDHRIALPLTYWQYKHLAPEKLIHRLVNRHEYRLAIRLSEFLNVSAHQVYIRWATHKVRTSQADEEEICNAIIKRLKSKRGISFETVARAAYHEGRIRLAMDLLNQEPRAGKQVPLLMSMAEDELALDKAVAAGDTDLIYYALLHLKKTLPLASFFRMVTNRPLATALVESSARLQDQALLKDLYRLDDRALDGATLLFSEALVQKAPQTKVDKMKLGAKWLADNSKDVNATQMLRIVQEAQNFLRLQSSLDHDLASTLHINFMGLSMNETLFQLILHSQTRRAQKLSQDFHVSPRVYEWVRLRALVASRNWHELEDIAHNSKKSHVGWEAYFNEILTAGNTKLAGAAFVAKCSTLTARERGEMWVKCNMVQRAGEELAKARDIEGLKELKSKTGPRGKLDRIIAGLKGKR